MKFLRTTAVLALFSFPAFADIVIQDGKISASFTSQPLRQAIETISKQAGVQIIIDEAVAEESISANFKDLPLAIGIKKLLEGTGINYAVIAGPDGVPSAILISGSEKPGAPPKKLDTRPTSTPANYQNRSVVTPVNPAPPPPPVSSNVNPQNAAPTKDMKLPPAAGSGVGTLSPNQPQPAQPTTPRFDPNNIPTAGSLVPTVNPQQPQPEKNDPRVVNQNDENDEDEEER